MFSCLTLCLQIVESAPLVGEREDLSSLEKEYAQDDVIYQAKIQVGNQRTGHLCTKTVAGGRKGVLFYCVHIIYTQWTIYYSVVWCVLILSLSLSLSLQDLQSRYSKLRRTRGDGNCFFRAFAFGYMESLLHDRSDLARSGVYTTTTSEFYFRSLFIFIFPLSLFIRLRFCDAINKQKSLLLAMGYPTFTLEDFHESVSITHTHVHPPTRTHTHTRTCTHIHSLLIPWKKLQNHLQLFRT